MTKADCYFSFRSPYSWIASHWLERHLTPDERAHIRFIPYWEPRPDVRQALEDKGGRMLYTPMSRDKHLYILQDVRRLARGMGLAFRWPVDKQPEWELPIIGYLLAADQGRGDAYRATAYKMRWGLGADIHTLDAVAALLEGCGASCADVEAAVKQQRLVVNAVDILVEAGNRGVFGVPFFLVGADKFWGVDRLQAFAARLRVEEHAFGTAPQLPVAPGPEPDSVEAKDEPNEEWDAAGGCG
jgi:2-hydroxychromene-2-carboxylate isomerase